jgi:hypothetical protein
VLGRPVAHGADGPPRIDLDDGGHLRFVAASDERGPGIRGVRIALRDPDAARARALARGCSDADGRVAIGGVRFDLVAAR